jgi:pimeloyl-ACP methyl ester carboxylesterase
MTTAIKQSCCVPGREPRPSVINTKAGPIEYAEFGEGPAVLAIHGAMGGYDQSLILARIIGAPGYRYIAISRPGYLGTPISSGRSPEQQADLCASLLDELGIREAVVAVVSGGGPCALQFALRYSERCRALVLVSTCSGKVETRIPLSFRIMKLMVRSSFFASRIEKKLAQDPERAASRSIPDPALRARTLADPETGQLFRALLASTATRMSLRMAGTENDIATTRSTTYPLGEIKAPALIVHGTDDPMLPFEQHARGFEARMPKAELLVAEGGGHACIFTHREQIRPRVETFLAHSMSPTSQKR